MSTVRVTNGLAVTSLHDEIFRRTLNSQIRQEVMLRTAKKTCQETQKSGYGGPPGYFDSGKRADAPNQIPVSPGLPMKSSPPARSPPDFRAAPSPFVRTDGPWLAEPGGTASHDS